MKVLILSCNTGQGHNSAAKAVGEKLSELGCEYVIKDTLLYASKFYSKGISKSYNKIVMHTPRAFGVGYRFSKSIVYTQGRPKSIAYASNMLCSKKMYNDIISEQFDAVVCTHVFAGQAITHVKHKHGLEIPIYMISTDYSFCPFYDELDADKYFISMKEIENEYFERGLNKDKIVPSGIPVSGKFLTDIDKTSAKQALQIPERHKVCLVMSGSMGYGDIYQLIDKILAYNIENTYIIIISGNNKKLYNGLAEKYGDNTSVCVIGYTDKVFMYMKASDVVVTKPGGLSSTETMVCSVPLVLTKPIPGCETENFDLLTRLGAAYPGQKTDEAASGIAKILTDEKTAKSIVEMQNKYINKNAAKTICDIVLRGKVPENEFVS